MDDYQKEKVQYGKDDTSVGRYNFSVYNVHIEHDGHGSGKGQREECALIILDWASCLVRNECLITLRRYLLKPLTTT